MSVCLAICFGAGLSVPTGATTLALDRDGRGETTIEYRVKAGFVLNFLRFTSWPEASAENRADWTLCTYVDEEFFAILGQLAGKQVGQSRLSVYDGAKVDRAETCDAIFIDSDMDEAEVADILSRHRVGVLTIGTRRQFVTRGGHISIVPREGRFGFFLNVGSAEQAGLRFSSKLRALAVGEIISTGARE